MNRRKLSKLERQEVYRKCNGHCAYCGIEIDLKDMQVDHAVPLKIGGSDDLKNMLPACRSCNHYKATLDINGFKNYLSGIHKRLLRDSVTYQVAERFGIVEHKTDIVEFYFESMKSGQLERKLITIADTLEEERIKIYQEKTCSWEEDKKKVDDILFSLQSQIRKVAEQVGYMDFEVDNRKVEKI